MADNHTCTKSEVIDRLEQRVNNLDNLREVVTRLATISEVQLEQSRDRDKLIKQQSDTLISLKDYISEQKTALEKINNKIEKTDTKVEELDKKIVAQSIEIIKSNSFDIMKALKDKGIPFLLGGGILFLILYIEKFLK